VVSLLEARRLAFGYPHRPVGREVTLRVDAGEVVAVLGPNGGGKTTLFRTLLGWLRPSAGEVLLDGRPLATWSRAELARHVGYVPQAPGGHFAFSVMDVVLMGRTAHLPPYGVPSKDDRGIALDCLAQLGVAALAPRVFTELSGGERQLVLIARALAQQPRLIVMDEPTASLDFGNQIKVIDHIAGLRRRGVAVLLSTHHPDHARHVADRIIRLKNGVIAGEGPASALTVADLATLYDLEPARVSVAGPAWREDRTR
jgi:iron complex transport system ATP-binding protein